MSLFVSIDGVDGSGKGTQSELLYNSLISKGKDARLLSFPTYDDIASAAVKLYLGGKLGNNPSDTNAYAASVFFAVDRYISFRNDWEKDYKKDWLISEVEKFASDPGRVKSFSENAKKLAVSDTCARIGASIKKTLDEKGIH